jgi:hypothetical protein
MLAKKLQNEFAISFGSVSVQDPFLNDDGSEEDRARLLITSFIISMTKLLDADWLRGVQLFH